MPAPTIVVAARTGMENNADVQAQYDIDPRLMAQFDVVGTWGFTADPAYAFGGYFSNGFGVPAANGDSISFRFVAVAGIYTYRQWIPRCPDNGIATITLNGFPLIANQSYYGAVIAPNIVDLVSQVVIADGVQELKVAVVGKAPASSGYFCRMNCFQLVPWAQNAL